MDEKIEKRVDKLAVHIEDANRSADVAGEYAEEAGYKSEEAVSSAMAVENRLDEVETKFRELIDVIQDEMVSAEAVGVLEDVKASVGVVADQLEDHDDAEVRDEMESLRRAEKQIEEWLNEHYYE